MLVALECNGVLWAIFLSAFEKGVIKLSSKQVTTNKPDKLVASLVEKTTAFYQLLKMDGKIWACTKSKTIQ